MLDENSIIDALEELNRMQSFMGKYVLTESADVTRIFCNVEDGLDMLSLYYKGGAK